MSGHFFNILRVFSKMSEECITEWPPTGTGKDQQFLQNEQSPPPQKRRRLQSDKLVVSLISSPSSTNVDVLLAKWWKHKRKDLESSQSHQPLVAGKASINPSTILFHVSRLPEAREFIKNCVSHLLSVSRSYSTCYSLATCYQRLGGGLENVVPALQYAQQAKTWRGKEGQGETTEEGEESLGELEWLIELLERQKFVEEEKKKRLADLEISVLPVLMQQFVQVERRSCADLSCEEFCARYLLTQTPVIITGLVKRMTSMPWTLEHVKQVVGDKVAPLKKLVLASVEWAKLESAGECRVASFIDSLQQTQEGGERYLFDWSLPLNCPRLMEELTIPEYVSDDLLRRTPPGSLYRDSWPSLFIAPPNIVSELHVDAFASNFWMALFEGKKRWVFFPPEDTPLLYPIYHHSTDAVFQVDLSNNWSEAVTSHPLLALTHPRECVLEAGEFLFVPSGSAHRVENLERSLAISTNFVNASNYSKVLRELEVNGLVDPGAKELSKILKHMGCRQKQS